MSSKLPLPDVEYEIHLSESSFQISLNPGFTLERYRSCRQLGVEILGVAWVLRDVANLLDEELSQQS